MENVQSNQQVVALDIGTSKITVAVADLDDQGNPHIVGFSKVPAYGVQNGCIQDVALAVDSIRRAITEAQEMSQRTITSVAVALTGKYLRSLNKEGRLVMQEREVNTKSLKQIWQLAMDFDPKVDGQREDDTVVCHLLQGYTLDNDTTIIQDPLGMSCRVLKAHAHLAIGSETIIANLIKCIRRAGVDVECMVLQPWASAACCVTPTEKQLGVVAMDIGAGAVDIVCFQNGKIEMTAVVPFGGEVFTKDIASILRCTMEQAEELKIAYGHFDERAEDAIETIRYVRESDEGSHEMTGDQLVRILRSRALELVRVLNENYFKRERWLQRAASGIVLMGGVSQMPGFAELLDQQFGLPVRVGRPKEMKGAPIQMTAPEDATVVGIFREVYNRRQLIGKNSPTQTRGRGLLGVIKRFFVGDFSS